MKIKTDLTLFPDTNKGMGTPLNDNPLNYYNGVFAPGQTKEQLQIGREIDPTGVIGKGGGLANGLVFTAVDFNTVQWTLGVIALTNGATFNIVAGNTGNLTALTYIYLDTITGLLVMETVAANAVGINKILICVANVNVDTTKKATFQAFGTDGKGVFITADNIAANSITANEIAVNTITSNKIATGTINIGKTDGTIESPSGAQSKVNTLSGSLGSLAYDNLVGAAKLDSTVISGGYIQTSLINATSIFAQNITATGTITGATLNGGTITGSTIKTSASGQRVEIGPYLGTDVLAFFNTSGVWAGTLYGHTDPTTGATITANTSSLSASNYMACGLDMLVGRNLSISGSMISNINMNNRNITNAFNISTTNMSASLITTNSISNNSVQGNPLVVTGGYISNMGFYVATTSAGSPTYALGGYACNVSGVTKDWLTQ